MKPQIENLHPAGPEALTLLRDGIQAIDRNTQAIQALPERLSTKTDDVSQTAILKLCGGLLIVGLILIAVFKKKPS